MKNPSYYFSHDYHARNDRKLVKAKIKHGTLALGIYWSLIEMLYEEGGRIAIEDCDTIATELRQAQDADISQFCAIVKSVIFGFDLFKNDEKYFWSESVKRRLDKRLEKSEKAKESASHRWKNANAKRTHIEGNAIKEKKKKEKENIDIAFDVFWKAYQKKKDKGKAQTAWNKLTNEARQRAIDYIPTYFEKNTDYQYQKYPATYLNSNCWEDEDLGNVVQMEKKIKAVGFDEQDWIIYEDGTKRPPGSYPDVYRHKKGELPLSHFDRIAS